MMKSKYEKDFTGDPTWPVHGFDHDKGKPKFFGNDRVDNKTIYKVLYKQHDFPGHPITSSV